MVNSWPETIAKKLYKFNNDIIGPNINGIPIGMKLKLQDDL